jgi:hypothetical protein
MCDNEWLTVVCIDTTASQADGSKTYTIAHTQILSDASTVTLLLFTKSYWTPKQKQLLVIPLHWLLTQNKAFVIIIQAGMIMK